MATLNIKNCSHPLHYVNVAIGLYSTSCHSAQYSLHVSSVNPFIYHFPISLINLHLPLSFSLSPSPLSLPPSFPTDS